MYKGKIIFINRHALDGMNAERPPIKVNDVEETLRNPDSVNGRQYRKWIGNRTIIIYVEECPDYWDIRSVSSTRRRI
jgi:hypothetical protein